jgi:DNA-binding response OmpR family regulator
MMMVHVLTRAGCQVAMAWDVGKGMALARSGDFDLITLDVDMLDEDGFRIFHWLKETPCCNQIPIVFVSARRTEKDVQRGLELGAVDYIVKPFEATDFVFRIVSHLRDGGKGAVVPGQLCI